jgi:hypothetical protein
MCETDSVTCLVRFAVLVEPPQASSTPTVVSPVLARLPSAPVRCSSHWPRCPSSCLPLWCEHAPVPAAHACTCSQRGRALVVFVAAYQLHALVALAP